MRFLGKFRFLGRSPLTIVETIIAIGAIVSGLYIVTPGYVFANTSNGSTTLLDTIGDGWALDLYGLIYLTAGIVSLVGILRRKISWRSMGLFTTMLCRIYSLFGVFITQGLLPLTWLSLVLVIFISMVVWLWLRGLAYRGLLE